MEQSKYEVVRSSDLGAVGASFCNEWSARRPSPCLHLSSISLSVAASSPRVPTPTPWVLGPDQKCKNQVLLGHAWACLHNYGADCARLMSDRLMHSEQLTK